MAQHKPREDFQVCELLISSGSNAIVVERQERGQCHHDLGLVPCPQDAVSACTEVVITGSEHLGHGLGRFEPDEAFRVIPCRSHLLIIGSELGCMTGDEW